METLTPTLVITNLSKQTVTVLGEIPINPGATIDAFKINGFVSESTVLDHIREPSGELYQLQQQRMVKIGAIRLVSTNWNPTIPRIENPDQLATGIVTWNAGVLQVKPGSAITGGTSVEVAWPLQKTADGKITLAKADSEQGGYVDAKDWTNFADKLSTVKIWQYQDFPAPLSGILTLSKFENGKHLEFSRSLIVSGSAVATSLDDSAKPLAVSRNWFLRDDPGYQVEIQNHLESQVFLDKLPQPNIGARIWFLVHWPATREMPFDYLPPPKSVRNKRIEYFQSRDLDSGARKIQGEREFLNYVNLAQGGKVAGVLEVDRLKASHLQLDHAAGNHLVLSSNAVGQSAWIENPKVGQEPPLNPYAGQLWVKLPEAEVFCYTGRRWLSIAESFIVSGSADEAFNTMNLGFRDFPSTNIDVLPYDSVLTEFSAHTAKRESWQAEIIVAGQTKAALNLESTEQAYRKFDLEFSAGTRIQLCASTRVMMPKIRAVFRKRFG